MKKHHLKSQQEIMTNLDINNCCCTNDSTGLIPSGQISKEELDSYESVYDFYSGQAATKNSFKNRRDD